MTYCNTSVQTLFPTTSTLHANNMVVIIVITAYSLMKITTISSVILPTDQYDLCSFKIGYR